MEINLSARDLRAFMTLARTRSFSKAAQQLHLSQSALSSLIARLEDTLGARLFDRTTRTVALSAAGDILFGRADHLLDELEQTVRAVRDVAVLRRGSVAIATLPSLAARLVPALFRAFSEIHPDICLSVMDTLSAPAFELVREGRVDFALTAANPQYEDLNYKPLTTDTFVLLASVNHPLGSIGRSTPGQCTGLVAYLHATHHQCQAIRGCGGTQAWAPVQAELRSRSFSHDWRHGGLWTRRYGITRHCCRSHWQPRSNAQIHRQTGHPTLYRSCHSQGRHVVTGGCIHGGTSRTTSSKSLGFPRFVSFSPTKMNGNKR